MEPTAAMVSHGMKMIEQAHLIRPDFAETLALQSCLAGLPTVRDEQKGPGPAASADATLERALTANPHLTYEWLTLGCR